MPRAAVPISSTGAVDAPAPRCTAARGVRRGSRGPHAPVTANHASPVESGAEPADEELERRRRRRDCRRAGSRARAPPRSSAPGRRDAEVREARPTEVLDERRRARAARRGAGHPAPIASKRTRRPGARSAGSSESGIPERGVGAADQPPPARALPRVDPAEGSGERDGARGHAGARRVEARHLERPVVAHEVAEAGREADERDAPLDRRVPGDERLGRDRRAGAAVAARSSPSYATGIDRPRRPHAPATREPASAGMRRTQVAADSSGMRAGSIDDEDRARRGHELDDARPADRRRARRAARAPRRASRTRRAVRRRRSAAGGGSCERPDLDARPPRARRAPRGPSRRRRACRRAGRASRGRARRGCRRRP